MHACIKETCETKPESGHLEYWRERDSRTWQTPRHFVGAPFPAHSNCVCMCVMCMYVCMIKCMHTKRPCCGVCMYVCVHVCMYVCMYVCACCCVFMVYHYIHAHEGCMCVCMYVCMCELAPCVYELAACDTDTDTDTKRQIDRNLKWASFQKLVWKAAAESSEMRDTGMLSSWTSGQLIRQYQLPKETYDIPKETNVISKET